MLPNNSQYAVALRPQMTPPIMQKYIPGYVWIALIAFGLLFCGMAGVALKIYANSQSNVAAEKGAPVLTPEVFSSIQGAVDKLSGNINTLQTDNANLRQQVERLVKENNEFARLLTPISTLPALANDLNQLKARVQQVETSQPSTTEINKLVAQLGTITQQVTDITQASAITQSTYRNQQTQIKQLYDALSEIQTRSLATSAPAQTRIQAAPSRVQPQAAATPGNEPTVMINEKTGEISSNVPLTPEMLRQLLNQSQNQQAAPAQPTAANQATQPAPLPTTASGLWGQR